MTGGNNIITEAKLNILFSGSKNLRLMPIHFAIKHSSKTGAGYSTEPENCIPITEKCTNLEK